MIASGRGDASGARESSASRRRPPRPGRRDSGLPGWVLLPAALGALLVVLPVLGMILRADPLRLWSLITTEESLDALWLSLRTATISTVLCLLLGTPMALVLARTSFPGHRFVRSLVLLPLVLPPVVGGLALLYVFGRFGLIGQHLEAAGISIAFSTAAVVLAQTFVSLPFLVVGLEGALRSAGTRCESLAATLGAGPTTVLRRITLPLALPGIASGAVLAFARSLGEFGATLSFAGSLQGVTRTLPLEIYLQRESDPQAAVALALVLVVVAVLIVGLTAPGQVRRARPRPDDDAGPSSSWGSGPARGQEPEEAERAAAADAGAAQIPPRAPIDPAAGGTALQAGFAVRDRDVALELAVRPGQTVALMGRNGSGKSTALDVLAGLLVPDRGRVTLGDRVLLETEGRGAWVPSHRRRITLMAQQPLLFPHLSVLDNAAFAPRCAGMSRAAARERGRHWLREVDAEQFAQRRPSELSGGQAQRVALARALAAEPQVLLLDEPLAPVDAEATERLRGLLRRVLDGRTAVVVTHDPLDARALAHRTVHLA